MTHIADAILGRATARLSVIRTASPERPVSTKLLEYGAHAPKSCRAMAETFTHFNEGGEGASTVSGHFEGLAGELGWQADRLRVEAAHSLERDKGRRAQNEQDEGLFTTALTAQVLRKQYSCGGQPLMP